MNRRVFIGSVIGAGVLAKSPWTRVLAQNVHGVTPSGQVKTTSGPIRGVVVNKINAFYGVPYGAPTSGAGRFMPPRKPQAWTSVRDCTEYGPRCPQAPGNLIPEVLALDRLEAASEDCLRLNVWTPALGAGRRPVMVWMHGGGFARGSGSFIMLDGANLSRRRDVVVVTLNHRINMFGYIHLGDLGGPQYAESGNAGMLDIVQALEWVRDNIAAFGGDPGNVTIFGQSGGGAKVCTLMGMPSAKGLFQKAIAQSGANVTGMSKADATHAAESLLARLNLKPNQVDEMVRLPTERLVGAMVGSAGAGGLLNFEPVVDGKVLPAGPFDPVASPLSATIPLLCGTTETEITWSRTTPLDDMDDARLRAALKPVVRADDAAIDRLVTAYRQGRPGAPNIDLYLAVSSDIGFRAGTVTAAERKADAKQAPVYMYYFTWRSPVRDGKLKAIHMLEVPFQFENVDLATALTGAHQRRYALQDRMSAAWVNFARTGNPNVKGLIPEWPAFDTARRATMIIDNDWTVVNDPHGAERRELNAIRG